MTREKAQAAVVELGSGAARLGKGLPAEMASDPADQWAALYAELITFEEGILSAEKSRLEGLAEEARSVANATDIQLLESLVSEWRRRQALWNAKRRSADGV